MRVPVSVMLALALFAPASASGQEDPTRVSLHLAALQGDTAVVRQHIAAGSDLDARDAYGSTPLIIAAAFDRTEVARALLEAGADPDVRNRDGGGTALHTAAFLCRTEIVRAMLEYGADKYHRDDYGNTPFESVADPFEEARPVYDAVQQALGPLGLQLDHARIEATRPVIAAMLRPRAEELEAVDYAPATGGDWDVSTPAEVGLDPALVAELYLEAAATENVYGLLVVRNGRLIAEGYFNEGALERKNLLQSVTKSYTSALVGIALEQGCLSSVDRRMMEFFPEFADRVTDQRTNRITIRQMLQMRAGYPWEETNPAYWDSLLTGEYLHLTVDMPLVTDPGAAFAYSNLTSHWLGVIVARACGTDLRSFAQEHLLGPLDAEPGEWIQDRDGYYMGHAELRLTARDAAKFGLLYLNDGMYRGNRLVPAAWIEESLQPYSERVTSGGVEDGEVGRYHRDVGYGYQWWSARAGGHRFDYAWGHGGQFIVLLDELDMVVVLVSDPFYVQHDEEAWLHERANLNLVGKFISSLPEE